MWTRVRERVLADDDFTTSLHRIGPALLLIAIAVYLVFGASSFWLFERNVAEQALRQHYHQAVIERSKFARLISQRIFNDTKNLFVVIDKDQSNRVQAQIGSSLREYEQRLNVPRPSRFEWDFGSSLGFAWGLLTTLGHSNRSPRTMAGQLFALVYAVIGVPFFVLSIVLIAHRVFQLLKSNTVDRKRRLQLLVALAVVYVLGHLGFVWFLTSCEIVASFWRAVQVTTFSVLSIHTNEYSVLSDADKLLTLFAVTVSLMLGGILLFLCALLYDTRDVPASGATNKVASEGGVQDPPRFQVVVDESGETKLQTTTSH